MIGNFKDGLYHGNMYINTLNADGNVQEWRGEAKEDVFKTFEEGIWKAGCRFVRMYRTRTAICGFIRWKTRIRG